MTEIALSFPYLDNENENGVLLSGDSAGKLDQLINYNKDNKIRVTLYPAKDELKYALGSAVRYTSVDMMFVVGEISSFDPMNRKVYINIYDESNIESVMNGKVLPRLIGTSVKDGEKAKMKISHLISLDILQQ